MTALTDSQRRQVSDSIGKSLLAAGIGRAFHHRTLAEVPQGDMLLDWIKGAGRAEVRAGRGWTIVGSSATAYDTAMLLARGLHLSGLKARVVSLSALLTQIRIEGDLLPEYVECDVLLVKQFYQVYPGNPTPFTGAEVRVLEDFLNDRMDDQRALLLQSAKPLAEATWWSADLLQRIATVNRAVVVVS